jgi:hypothetical protein
VWAERVILRQQLAKGMPTIQIDLAGALRAGSGVGSADEALAQGRGIGLDHSCAFEEDRFTGIARRSEPQARAPGVRGPFRPFGRARCTDGTFGEPIRASSGPTYLYRGPQYTRRELHPFDAEPLRDPTNDLRFHAATPRTTGARFCEVQDYDRMLRQRKLGHQPCSAGASLAEPPRPNQPTSCPDRHLDVNMPTIAVTMLHIPTLIRGAVFSSRRT